MHELVLNVKKESNDKVIWMYFSKDKQIRKTKVHKK